MKLLPVEAELFLSDEQTERHYEANSYFSEFLKKPKNDLVLL
jgi:hypothetical protein